MTARHRVVAGTREAVVHASLQSFLNDLHLGEVDQGGMNRHLRPFDPSFRGDLGEPFEGFDKLGTAVGVPGIVHRVDADVNLRRSRHLGISEGHTEHHGVAGGDVGDGNPFGERILRDVDIGGESAASKLVQGNRELSLTRRAESFGDPFGALEFVVMPLPIRDGETVTLHTPILGHREDGGGIEASAQQHHGPFHHPKVPGGVPILRGQTS